MSKFSEKAAAALDLLPEELQEPAVAYILEQAEKFRSLRRTFRPDWMMRRLAESVSGTLPISCVARVN
jgi:hypothetical protein